MFFNERPEDFFPYTRIEVIDKPDPTGIGMTEKIFTGPLNRQLRDALSYIKNYIIKEKVIKISNQAEAVRIFNLPYAAVEESLSNAVYHKSYQIGEPITVTVTPERMEITSLPGPDRTISNEDLMNRRLVSRRYRNRRIGDFLKELKLVEGRNTGIPTILHAMEANGSELPLFETDEDRTYFTVILPVHKQFLVPGTAAPKKKQRRSLPELKSSNFNMRSFGERVALNMPIQGTAADIIKLAMVNVDRRLRSEGLEARLILQVHDELIVECPESEAERVSELLKYEMEHAAQLAVPLTVDVKTGKSWAEAH